MISEKTVELNLTTELINWLYTVTEQTHYALAPSQREEGTLGYDVALLGSGAILIQYKRAYVEGTNWSWNLNRTQQKNQHSLLLDLEAQGFPVFYALPHFNTPAHIAARRRRLLLDTFWFPPSSIRPPGGPNGHHEVHYDESSRRWWVTSQQEVEMPPPLDLNYLSVALGSATDHSNLEKMLEALNSTILKYEKDLSLQQAKNEIATYDLVDGLVVIVRATP